MQIKQGVACHPSNYSSRNGTAIRYIVIHYTANNGDTAQNNCTYSSGANRGASAHYFVGEDGIYQSVPDIYRAWHCGGTSVYKHPQCRNANSVGIEMCSRKDSNGNYYIKDEVVSQAVELTRYLMAKYGIDASRVLRHYDVWDKRCPEPFVRNPQLWTDFKQRLVEEDIDMEELKQLRKQVDELKKRVDEFTTPKMIYNYIDENMPKWAHEGVQWCLDNGIIKGTGEGLGLDDKDLRICAIMMRLAEGGVYNG